MIKLFENQTEIIVEKDQAVIEKKVLKTLLEKHLNISQNVDGKNPAYVYAEKMKSIAAKTIVNRVSNALDAINELRDELSLLDAYYDGFVIPHLEEQIDADVASFEDAQYLEQ